MKRFVTLLFCAIGMLYCWTGIAGALDSLKGPAEKLIVQQIRQTPPQLASAESSKYSPSTVASEAWTDWRDCSMLFDTLKELNCALAKMKQSGASQESMNFVRELAERKEGEGLGWLGEFREIGRVDLGSVEFPFRANTNTAFFLLNGSPSLISTELGCTVGGGWHQPCQRKGAVDISQDPNYPRLKNQYPNLELWPAGADFKSAQAKPDGGQRFIFSYILVNGCHACYVGSRAEVAFDFDRNGTFKGTKLLRLDGVNAENLANASTFYGPTPYLSFRDSPFFGTKFSYFHLEDFEDGLLNTPGVTTTSGWVLHTSVGYRDSVDADDGNIDGSGSQGNSYISNFQNSLLLITFNASDLGGKMPTHAGIVWTDVGRNGGGDGPGSQPVIFSATDSLGNVLGTKGPYYLGDKYITGQTAEDRFFGVYNPSGISSITISMPGSNNWEVDHLQYGNAIEKFKQPKNLECNAPLASHIKVKHPTCKQKWGYHISKVLVSKHFSAMSILLDKKEQNVMDLYAICDFIISIAAPFSIVKEPNAALMVIKGSYELPKLLPLLGSNDRPDELDQLIATNLSIALIDAAEAAAIETLTGNVSPLAIPPKLIKLVNKSTTAWAVYNLTRERLRLLVAQDYLTDYYELGMDRSRVAEKYMLSSNAPLKEIINKIAGYGSISRTIWIPSNTVETAAHYEYLVNEIAQRCMENSGQCSSSLDLDDTGSHINCIYKDPGTINVLSESVKLKPTVAKDNKAKQATPKSSSKANKHTRAACNKGSSVSSPSIGGAQGALKKYGTGTDGCAQ